MRLNLAPRAAEPRRPAAARRAHQPPRPRRGRLARALARGIPRHAAAWCRTTAISSTPASRTWRTSRGAAPHAIHGQLLVLRGTARRAPRRAAGDVREAAARDRAHQRSSSTRFRAKATKARQAQSRLKALDRLERVAPAHVDAPFDFEIPAPARAPSPLLTLEDAALGYRGPHRARARATDAAARRATRTAGRQRRRQVHADQGDRRRAAAAARAPASKATAS